MRKAIWIVFALAFIALNICLLLGITGEWSEAALGIVPSALVAFICFVLLLAGVGAKTAPRWRAPSLWAGALLWSLLMGGLITYETTNKYERYMRPVTRTGEVGFPDAYGRRQIRTYTTYDEQSARDQRIGMVFGWTLLGFAGVAFVGLLISLIIALLRKKAPDSVSAT